LVNALIMTEPTSSSGGGRINRRQESQFFAQLTAESLIPSRLYEREDGVRFGMSCNSLGFVCCNTEILNSIYLSPLFAGAVEKEFNTRVFNLLLQYGILTIGKPVMLPAKTPVLPSGI